MILIEHHIESFLFQSARESSQIFVQFPTRENRCYVRHIQPKILKEDVLLYKLWGLN